MKRSEMAEEILQIMNSIPNGSLMVDVAYKILKGIEENGMLPPTITKYNPLSDSMSGMVEYNEWEPENETK